jgi:hypothetical protein
MACMFVAFLKHNELEGSCPRSQMGRIPNGALFECSSEQVKCDLMPFIRAGLKPHVD